MARQIWDSVVETSTSTGTGAFTLAGALTGYARFDDVALTGDRITYMIEAIDGNGDRTGEWETGDGTYSATDTLTRTTFHNGSNYPSATNFSAGTKRVSLIIAAAHYRHRGCLVTKTADQTAANYTTITAVAWDSEDYDTTSFHDNVTNTTRITIPDGVTRVRLRAKVRIESLTASNYVALYIYKNASTAYTGQAGAIAFSNQTVMEVDTATPVLSVTSGDYFEAYLEIGTDTSVTVKATRSWFEVEVVE